MVDIPAESSKAHKRPNNHPLTPPLGVRDRLDSVYAELLELESSFLESGPTLLLLHAGDLVDAAGLSRWLQPTNKRAGPRLTDGMRAAYLLRKLEWYDYMASSELDEETRARRAARFASFEENPRAARFAACEENRRALWVDTLDDEGRFSLERYAEVVERATWWSGAPKWAVDECQRSYLGPTKKERIKRILAEPVWPDIAAIAKAIERGHTVDRVTTVRPDPDDPVSTPRRGRPRVLNVRSESGVWQDKADRLRHQLTPAFFPRPDEPAEEWVRRAGQRVKEWRRSSKYRLLDSLGRELT